MNYVGKKVKHAIFGTGEIISQDEGNRVGVRFFDGSVKEFVAPKCFETFLVLQDPSARAEAIVHLAEHEKREKAEVEIKKKEAWEKSLNRAAERKRESGKNKEMKVQSYATVSSFFDAQKANLETEAGYLRATGGRRYRLSDGEHIAVSGDKHIYSFESDTELNLPDNIGITLWKGDQSFAATLISCEEFSLIVAVSSFIGNSVPEIEFTFQGGLILIPL